MIPLHDQSRRWDGGAGEADSGGDAGLLRLFVSTLKRCIGAEHGITIGQLQVLMGIPSRRECEHFLEEHFEDFPFLVVAGHTGYFRPASAKEINEYYRNLTHRAQRLYRRLAIVERKALAEGYRREGGDYVADPAQLEMPFEDVPPHDGAGTPVSSQPTPQHPATRQDEDPGSRIRTDAPAAECAMTMEGSR